MSFKYEQRAHERDDCDIPAQIELSDRLAIACRVKDLSAIGCKIEINEGVHLPDEFDLLVPVIESTFQRYRVRMVWRKENLLGGEFLSPQPH